MLTGHHYVIHSDGTIALVQEGYLGLSVRQEAFDYPALADFRQTHCQLLC